MPEPRLCQLAKIRETVQRVRCHSPFYRERLGNIAEDRIQSLEDVRRLPFTTADDLSAHSGRFLCVSQSDVSRVVTLDTSGTTGRPKRVYFSAEDQELTIQFFEGALPVFASAIDRILIGLPGDHPGSVGDLLAQAITRFGATPVPYGPIDDLPADESVIDSEQITCIIGIPEQLFALARCNQRPHVFRSVVLCSDYVSSSIVDALRQTWKCEVFEHYGMTEMGLGGGVDCAAHCGYHLRDRDLYFEIVDPATGVPVPAGQLGEIVFTTLTRNAMPLIRYRTGDLSRFLPAPCPCGMVLPRLERVRGRISEPVSLGTHGPLSIVELDDSLFSIAGLKGFRAALTPGPPIRLALTASGGGRDIERQILRMLESVPPIERARRAGDLELEISITPELPHTLPGKRRIQCCIS